LRELQQRQVPQEAKILVIDKGTGMLGRFLMQNWYTNISLLALSPKMADLAKADASYQDKEIMVGTPLNHEFKEKYDVIVASEILQYFVRDSAELWCHLSGALKNPGLLVSSDIYPLPEAEKCFQEVKFSHHDMHIQGQTVRRMAMNVFAGVRSSSS
jgi:SAM-dependent methyltransferase